jgi:hypothetical protein
MKLRDRFFVLIAIIFSFTLQAIAQGKIDEERMQRDIEVAENILSTVIKQQFEKRSFFPMEINGEYREGYGVTFRLPYEVNGPMIWNLSGQGGSGVTILDGNSYSYSFSFPSGEEAEMSRVLDDDMRVKSETIRGTGRVKAPSRKVNIDSIRESTSNKIIDACKDFLANYGDLITQLPANEKIMITNRGEGERIWYGAFVNGSHPSYMSIEVSKLDITSYKQGKLSREQFDKKIKVINSVMDDELQPDLELLNSIFNRLYRQDLSHTFFTEEDLYYERMKDYGVIYYMEVYSSTGLNSGMYGRKEDVHPRYVMPTLGLEGLTQEERDKKVIELYPKFEKNIKEDILEYGRTVKSLKPEESLIFNIKLTRCEDCGIPSSLEISVKADVLNDYSSGKLSKEAALGKFSVKKGTAQ